MTTQVQAKPEPEVQVADSSLLPPVDVAEDAAGITLYADLPGVPKERLKLQVEAQTLTIEGDLQLEVPEGTEAVHAEIGSPRFKRVFTLSRELDSEKVSADFNQGVLKVRIPKVAHAQPRKVSIRVE
ncbi:MAG: Hsp20/alpha crystallin family protein [Betaproteobacteria bacterium]|nr:Hsp20/alpha crystallin family protein [Betaproteobacteria bacterium]MDE2622012.1 Hsp20/alpha crystallin family protein [Betaproteobacteria bacterium]